MPLPSLAGHLYFLGHLPLSSGSEKQLLTYLADTVRTTVMVQRRWHSPVFKGLAHQIGSKVLTFPSGGLVILRFKNMLYEKELEGVKERRKLHFGK